MKVVYVIIGVVGLVFMFIFFQKKKQCNSPYLKVKKKLEEELLQVNFSGDWKKRQIINLQLLWIRTIKDVESRDIFLKKKSEHKVKSLFEQLSEDEIRFPNKWKLDDLYHFPFTQEIIASYTKTLEENDYKDIYKPESILLYPKDIIIKAINFTFDYLKYDKPLYEIPNKQEMVDNLNSIKFSLTQYFVDSSQKDLLLIDWRSRLIEATRDADDNLIDVALMCIDREKSISPKNNNAKERERIIYQHIAKLYETNNDSESAEKYMKKAADLQKKD